MIFNNISNDLISHICTTFILIPCLSKSIYMICTNSKIYKEAIKEDMIKNFIKNLPTDYYNLIKKKQYLYRYSYEFFRSNIDNVTLDIMEDCLKYNYNINKYTFPWTDIPSKYLNVLSKKYEQIRWRFMTWKFGSGQYKLTNEDYELLLSYESSQYFKKIPINKLTKKMCEIAVKTDNDIFTYIDHNYKDNFDSILSEDDMDKLCLIASYENPTLISRFWRHHNKEEIYKHILSKNGSAFAHISSEEQTKDYFKIASKTIHLNYFLSALNLWHGCKKSLELYKSFFDKETLMNTVKADISNIGEIPKEYLTEELCYIAVKANDLAVRFIPRNIIEGKEEEFYKCNPSCAHSLNEEYIKRFIQDFDL